MNDRGSTSGGMTLERIRASKTATISRAEAAAALGVDPRTVSVGIAQGTIPALRVGRRVLIPRERFLAIFDPSGVEAA